MTGKIVKTVAKGACAGKQKLPTLSKPTSHTENSVYVTFAKYRDMKSASSPLKF